MKLMIRDIICTTVLVMPVIFMGCGDGQAPDDHASASHQEETAAIPDNEHDHEGEALHSVAADVLADEQNHAEEADEHAHEDLAGTAGGDWESLMQLETVTAVLQPMELTLDVPGTIIPHPDKAAVISPFIESSINNVFVNAGDMVRAGDLMVCLTSPEIGMLRAEYDKAEAELAISQSAYDRQKRLRDEDIVSQRAIEEAERDLTVARVTREYARRRLLAVGLSTDEIGSGEYCAHDLSGSSIHVNAPISGTVVRRNACIGEKVDPTVTLFELVDLDPVWIEAEVFVKDLTRINRDDRVYLLVASYDTLFTAKVVNIGDTVDGATRTVKVTIEAANSRGLLKPGMFATVKIVTDMLPEALVVPREAVLDDGALKVVFVREGESYHRHVVETGIETGSLVQIVSGLEAGDTVVTTGNFQLASQSQMSAVDPHAGHNH